MRKDLLTYLHLLSRCVKGIGLPIMVLSFLVSCEYTGYETGDGRYSYMRADYADVTIEQGKVVSIVTDEDQSLMVPSSFAYSERKDTMMRCLLYYKSSVGEQGIQVIAQKSVALLIPLKWQGQEKAQTDPLTLTAVWTSANRRYINMQLGIKTGSSEAEARQSLALRCDSVSTYGKGAVWLTLCHDQDNIPQYYTKELLFSIPLNVTPDTIQLKINTYSGMAVRKFIKSEL